jgi:hypothetical protein
MTSVDVRFLRRADDLGMIRDLRKTTNPFVTETGDEEYPTTVADTLKDRIPFFGGEYNSINIEETYAKTIGSGMLKTADIEEDELHINDYNVVTRGVRRKIQYCKITDIPDELIEEDLETSFKTNPSRVTFQWNDSDFPPEISVIDDVIKARDIKTQREMQEELVIDSKLFNPRIREFIAHHTNTTRVRRAQRG